MVLPKLFPYKTDFCYLAKIGAFWLRRHGYVVSRVDLEIYLLEYIAIARVPD